MHPKIIATALFSAVLSASAHAGPILVSSTFDSDTDGWTAIVTNASSTWAVQGVASAIFDSDGSPGGSLRVTDPDSWWSYFVAPSRFLGNKSAAFGGTLSFDSRYVTPADRYDNEADVVLKGAGLTLVRDVTSSLPGSWTHYEVALSGGAWRVNSTFSGAVATDAQILAVLTNLDAMWINGEHFSPVKEVIALDNVVLAAPVPEPETYAMMLAGLGMLGAIARRRRAA